MKKVIKALVIIIAIILVITATIGIFIWTKLNKINYEKISKEDIGIIKENLGNGNIYKETDENGNTKYIQNHQEGQNGNLEWIDEQNIGDVIAVIDKENHTTIAGIGEIEGKYVPVEIKQMILSQDAQNPYKESEYYVKLKGSEKNYTRLNKAYQKRLKEIEAKSKQDTEMEIS